MRITQIGKIGGGQDGAIWKNELFRFDHTGRCCVYDLSAPAPSPNGELAPIAAFTLDRADRIAPHSNAVCFGTEFFSPTDEYPLLYTNVYNNYAGAEDKLVGVCCVYRVQREGNAVTTTLVQLIEIGFVREAALWRAYPDRDGPRPYGNFVIDRDEGSYYAFVMRNEELGTAYFKFDLPSVNAGEIDPTYGVRRVVLGREDVRASFSCPYHRYIQGAAAYKGKIYSTEGFRSDTVNRPAIRVIAPAEKKQEHYYDLLEMGFFDEPEMIDFYHGTCYYSDNQGNLYAVAFEG